MTKEERLAAVNEVKVLSMMNHPYIIEYYENFLEDKALMIVMEYAQGDSTCFYKLMISRHKNKYILKLIKECLSIHEMRFQMGNY